MNDAQLLAHITELVDEEHRLRDSVDIPEQNRDRLMHLVDQLDQCWDLLRQRRARRAASLAAEDAEMREVRLAQLYTR